LPTPCSAFALNDTGKPKKTLSGALAETGGTPALPGYAQTPTGGGKASN
jgi:hypothetical protein